MLNDNVSVSPRCVLCVLFLLVLILCVIAIIEMEQLHQNFSEWNLERSKRDVRKPLFVRHLLIVRHSESIDDEHVTERGLKQSRLVGQKLRKLHKHSGLDSFTTSSQSRTIRTARAILNEIGDPWLSNISIIDPMLQGWDVKSENDSNYKRLGAAYTKYFSPRDSLPASARQRDRQCVYDVIVCHSSAIRYYIRTALNLLQLNRREWLRYLPNASITWVMINATGEVLVEKYGDTRHLSDIITND